MICIVQPTFMPWSGFFALMNQCDTVVLLDSVQFSKQSWQQRNRIRTDKGLEFLSVPVKTAGRFGQKISEVEIARTKPTAAATAKEMKAACLTDFAFAKPDATNRVGPTRLSSVPLIPSE